MGYGSSDGGTAPPADDGGCGCITMGTRSNDGSAGALRALLGLALVVSRRRRRL